MLQSGQRSQYVLSANKPLIAVLLGPGLLLLCTILPSPPGLSESGWQTLAIAVWMASWWALEMIPIPATALLPLIVFPLLDIHTLQITAKAYSHPIIFLFLGGFLVGIALQHWNLHRRLALHILLKTGSEPRRQLAGFMIATAFLSMWVSNTATSIMMLPIALSVIALEGEESSKFSTALLLGVAYSASIGGIATLIGTPPNALLAAYLQNSHGIEISFASWLLVGLPVSLSLLLLCWWWLGKGLLNSNASANNEELIRAHLCELGAVSTAEKRVLAVFFITAGLWVFRPIINRGLPELTDTGIALLAGFILFVLPAGEGNKQRLLDWEQAQKLPWGILLLFGGGLALAGAIQSSGLADWMASGLKVLADWPEFLLLVCVVAVIIFLTELTSNTATTASFLPLLGAFALAQNSSPLLLTVPAAIAASCAFMMPVATPPNAVVFGSGKLTIPDMMRQGLLLNLAGIAVVTVVAYGVISIGWL